MKLRVVGDIHGKASVINSITQSLHYYDLTVQIGDFGLGFPKFNKEKTPEEFLEKENSGCFKILLGNHDDYQSAKEYPQVLERFGTFEFADKLFFYVSGADSVDRNQRTQGIDWWDYEELSQKEGLDCLELWGSVKEKVYGVFSHDCPMSVAHSLGLGQDSVKSYTRQLLQQLYDIHEPHLWFFGHHHMSKTIKHRTTTFRCLGINEEVRLDF